MSSRQMLKVCGKAVCVTVPRHTSWTRRMATGLRYSPVNHSYPANEVKTNWNQAEGFAYTILEVNRNNTSPALAFCFAACPVDKIRLLKKNNYNERQLVWFSGRNWNGRGMSKHHHIKLNRIATLVVHTLSHLVLAHKLSKQPGDFFVSASQYLHNFGEQFSERYWLSDRKQSKPDIHFPDLPTLYFRIF